MSVQILLGKNKVNPVAGVEDERDDRKNDRAPPVHLNQGISLNKNSQRKSSLTIYLQDTMSPNVNKRIWKNPKKPFYITLLYKLLI